MLRETAGLKLLATPLSCARLNGLHVVWYTSEDGVASVAHLHVAANCLNSFCAKHQGGCTFELLPCIAIAIATAGNRENSMLGSRNS